MYRQSYQLFCRRYQNNVAQFIAIQKKYEREKLLYEKQVIASADFEQTAHEYENALSGLPTLYNEQVAQWRQEQQKYRDERMDIQSKILQLSFQQQELVIIAPESGTIQKLPALKVGAFVTEGEVLMEISPQGALYAECYLFPRDIGLIITGLDAFLQIDAFNYNEWGVLQAQVVDVACDVVMPDGASQPYFKVLCMPKRTYMTLKNGYTSPLKKGMSFSVRFTVARRTLFQWLYDKMDNWLNPNNVDKK